MTDHYYTAKSGAEHDEQSFSANLRGKQFRFVTDSAVFSRERVDFGSALLIEAMQIEPGDTVLDLGCGYGPIGIAAAHLAYRGQVFMVEVNERAALLARRNLTENRISNAEVRVGDGVEPVRGIAFDKVVTNPPIRAGKAVIYRMVDGAFEVLKPGGSLYVVIQTKQGAPSMKKKLAQLFGNVADVDRQAGYHIFQSIKPGP